jgi:hypothetical protein
MSFTTFKKLSNVWNKYHILSVLYNMLYYEYIQASCKSLHF